ncbi:transketolase [Legionella jordanis]|uniref:Transketolase n=1 Tax=Legionella jordanis TaxID=456 RepID=A0A0W0VC64_9GAMM|nr:transketolase [Legionella jordanis]KTD17712.1 transketolase [Legionella jordanis]RMX01577.1 transketolase [Legionella jordanis]VEH11354.1 transketolase [Legionella jordanis]
MSLSNDLVNAVRFLSIDAVEQAQSGHPGMPLGMAQIASVLWKKFLKHNPKNPSWFDRDRFVLSNGHGSMLLYSLLHLTGYNLSIDEIKNFRQLHSKTPGHPEHDTPGVETTTGPLGQGLANAVGMAIAEKLLATQFNRPGLELVNHHTYVFAGDGCLMEGISHEACSLAGTLGLGKLIVFYDDNGISIDGQVDSWFSDDTASRFKAYHWHVIGPIDGHDCTAIENAIEEARQESSKPSLIICKTIIGYGSSVAGSEKSHGSPLGAEGVKKVREHFNWPHPPFVIPDAVYAKWNHEEQGQHDETLWLKCCDHYQKEHRRDYHEFLRRVNGDLPDNWDSLTATFIETCRQQDKAQATRKSSQQCIEVFAKILPEMLGGSADLTGSNNTDWSGSKVITAKDFSGNYLHYGVREFAMAAIMNGLALHQGIIPYGGTFLVFADYARNAVRLSALMNQRVIYVFSHDSIGLGEDGPTHQPIEQAAMLRMTPNMHVWRPADLMETAVAWQQALERHNGPSSLLLSRQNLPSLSHQEGQAECIKKGGYVLSDCDGTPDAIVLATGSEVHLALEAAKYMTGLGKKIRVVSMPCCERFLAQDEDYQEKILPNSVRKRVAIEAAASDYWYRFVGLDGQVIGLDRFGVSAPAADAFQYLGITAEHLISALKTLLN